MSKALVFALAIAMVFSGCVSSSVDSKKMSRYKPKVGDTSIWSWGKSSDNSGGPRVSASDGSGTANAASSSQNNSSSQPQRTLLKRGANVLISIRDIPSPQDIKDVIDDNGCVNLPLIGTIKIQGKTSSEAESIIQNAYITGEYYRKINVIVIPEEATYFIRGEVKREGKYPLSPDLTLLRAIAESGGYTEYAKLRGIKIFRGEQILTFDAKRIEDRKDDDPQIKPGDIIVVERRIV